METLLTLEDLNALVHNPATWIILIWLGREVWHLFQKRGADLDKSIKDCMIKMSELTLAIVKLEAKIENLEKVAGVVPKIQDDLNILYRKVRNFDSPSTNS